MLSDKPMILRRYDRAKKRRATYSMEFSHYDYVPNELAEKVIATHKAAHGEQLVEEKA
jgi:hypothetical protein